MLSKMVGHDPVVPRTTEEIDSQEKDCMQPQSYSFPKHGCKDIQTHKQYTGMDKKIYPIFIPLAKWSDLALLVHSVSFRMI